MVSTWRSNIQELSLDKCTRLHSYFRFLRVAIFIMVLIMIHAWLENSIATILITHLTGDGLLLPKAASIVNVQDGISAFLLLFVAYVSNTTKIGSFGTVVFTTMFYITGLLLIFIAARKQKEEISSLFLAAIFIALGRSGRDISLKQFLADQCKAEWSLDDDDDEEKIENLREIYWRIASVSGVIVSICVSWIYNDIKWAELCKISTIAMALGFVSFLAGVPLYHAFTSPDGNSESAASRLLLAAIKKKHLPHDSAAAASDNRHIYMDMTLRWVNKAAIIEPSPSVEEQLSRGRLHTVEQVRKVKNMLSLIPLWTTFLVYGLLQATASVFFYEQVSYMEPQVGHISNVPVAIFAVINSSTSFVVSYICEKWFPSYSKGRIRRHVMLIRIGLGLAIAPICCVVAWRVESHRLEKYVKSEIVIDVVWLIPQFFLLGVLEGLVSDGMEKFFYANVSKSFKKYGPSFTQFAPNIGHFISLALVLNLRSLFGDDLNMSSLGLYYAILSYVCFVNFMFYCFVATHFVKRGEGETYAQDEETAADQGMEEELQNVADVFQDDAGNHEQEGESYAQHKESEGPEMEEIQNVGGINPDGTSYR